MLMRFDPFREFDRLNEQLGRQSRSVLAMDAVRDEDEVTVYIDVPGVSNDDIDVSVEKNELTVSIERRWNDEGKQVLTTERPQGSFARRLMLNDAVDLDGLKAKTSDGVLIISIPVAERSKPRRIDVETGDDGDSAIEATASDG
ncbi:MAG: Hsp20/alpha crystallin family protein [Ilumatobacter sp.]|nr:Hsp20/alpha crystallin family protein [Ilumatobacter sp.]